jgi:hypothetical protein
LKGDWRREVRGALQVVVAAGLLLAILLLPGPSSDGAASAGLFFVVIICGGFVAGARARKPVQGAALAGGLAYVGFLAYLAGWGRMSDLPDPPCVPCGSFLGVVALASLGGRIAATILPAAFVDTPDNADSDRQ